jgi:hypothetical protein
MHKIRHEQILVIFLAVDKLADARIKRFDGFFSRMEPLCQRRDLLRKGVGARGH